VTDSQGRRVGDPADEPAADPASSTAAQPRTVAALVCGAGAVVLLSLLALLPVPYAVESPGPVRDTLGEVGGVPLIEVSGAPTYPTEGSLALTTVRVAGGPGAAVSLPQVVQAWLDPTRVAVPVEQLFPVGTTSEQVAERDAADMSTSQENATAAALAELGIGVPTTLTVAGLSEGSLAGGLVEEGDVITAVDGAPVADLADLRAALQRGAAGEAVEVSLRRGDEPQEVAVPTSTAPDGTVQLGVLVDPLFDFPVDVRIQVDRIGGPSAGMVFALGVLDVLTPGSLTGGEDVAGTGTIDASGGVGTIGGIAQKMAGARAAGASLFLAPAGNCDEVVGHVPAGLRVVPVQTLHEAREAVEQFAAGRDADLASCPPGPSETAR